MKLIRSTALSLTLTPVPRTSDLGSHVGLNLCSVIHHLPYSTCSVTIILYTITQVNLSIKLFFASHPLVESYNTVTRLLTC